jgi:sucrose-6-phosphate hydrolase SacC (GH32 family)
VTISDIRKLVVDARSLREAFHADPHRPRYHLIAPEGFLKDVNGAMFWKGRYHVCMLSMTPVAAPQAPQGHNWRGRIWLHASSADLVHWIHHPPALRADAGNTDPSYVGPQSGDAIENAPVPTLIYHDGQKIGTSIAIAQDDKLIRWKTLPENPVIPYGVHEEVIVFDPCAWYQEGVYYALIGNKNFRPGFEGDSTSLFRSTNLIDWEYRGPFYKSDRKWTTEDADCACPDFFPLGERYMLLMHTHKPSPFVQYYLGRFEDERFVPEQHGRMSWPGGSLAGPETLLDGQGRRVLLGWIPEGPGGKDYWKEEAYWAGAVSLPRILSLDTDGSLRIDPAPELEALRINRREMTNIALEDGVETATPGVQGDGLELDVTFELGSARQAGLAVRCSPNGEEKTRIVFDAPNQTLEVESRTLQAGQEPLVNRQEAPFVLQSGETLRLRVFLDRSVLEVFANGRQCLTQRVYPFRPDSRGVALFARGGPGARARSVRAWDMMPVVAI